MGVAGFVGRQARELPQPSRLPTRVALEGLGTYHKGKWPAIVRRMAKALHRLHCIAPAAT